MKENEISAKSMAKAKENQRINGMQAKAKGEMAKIIMKALMARRKIKRRSGHRRRRNVKAKKMKKRRLAQKSGAMKIIGGNMKIRKKEYGGIINGESEK
jgi:hypothetical protein